MFTANRLHTLNTGWHMPTLFANINTHPPTHTQKHTHTHTNMPTITQRHTQLHAYIYRYLLYIYVCISSWYLAGVVKAQ